jgi:hypothetical protein
MRLALLLVALTACIDDHYTCSSDAECNVGEGGRCERDHLCTAYDASCPLERRYTAHSGSVAGACFAESAVPLDPCASGQAPAPNDTKDACASAVCAAVPSCCTSGWGEACVQAAEVVCAIHCDTRIAITAEQNLEPTATTTAFALLDLRLGTTTSYTRVDQLHGFLNWLAPARGQSEPRLAGLDASRAQVVLSDGAQFPVGTDRAYDSLQSVDFDRAGRDQAVFASYFSPDAYPADVIDLETGAERLLNVPSQLPLTSFGDWDGDAFPDAATALSAGGQGYQLLHSIDLPDHTRGVEVAWSSGVSAPTMGNAPLQAFAWADLDNDGRLDLIELGAEVRIHYGNDNRAPNSPRTRIDCDPLAINPPATCVGTDVEVIGTPVYTPAGTQLVLSIDNGTRNLYPVTFAGHTATPGAAILSVNTCGGMPCPPIRAVVARDVDGDHALDLIAIDAALAVHIRFASGGSMTIQAPAGLPAASFKVVRASVTGAVQ